MVEVITKRELEEIKKGSKTIDVKPSKSKSEREELFKQLDDKGIEYKKNMSGVKLKELLEGDK